MYVVEYSQTTHETNSIVREPAHAQPRRQTHGQRQTDGQTERCASEKLSINVFLSWVGRSDHSHNAAFKQKPIVRLGGMVKGEGKVEVGRVIKGLPTWRAGAS